MESQINLILSAILVIFLVAPLILILLIKKTKTRQNFEALGALQQLESSRPAYFTYPYMFNEPTRDYGYYNPYLLTYPFLYPYYPKYYYLTKYPYNYMYYPYAHADMSKVKGVEDPINFGK